MYFNPLSTQYNLSSTLGPYRYLMGQNNQSGYTANNYSYGSYGGGSSASYAQCFQQPVYYPQPVCYFPQPSYYQPQPAMPTQNQNMIWNCMQMMMPLIQIFNFCGCNETPTCEEPPVEKDKVMGSAGLYGDPRFGLFTPGLDNAPAALKDFQSGIQAGQTVTLLKDTDEGGLKVRATGVQVDPANADSTGIGSATFTSGNDKVVISGNGDLRVNGVKKGNLNDDGLIAPIKLSNGLTVSTAQEIDDAEGNKAERFVISNGEYKITAAPRKPHSDSTAYLDMNFEELTTDAADNATGYQTTITGLADKFGIADLLRFEPDDVIAAA